MSISLPSICAANPRSYAQWFACLKQLMLHCVLNEDEKFLWLWLATQSTNNESLACSLSYEQISLLTNRTPKQVHRQLTRLRTMGFLIADIPIYYGEPTPEMVQRKRNLQLMMPPKSLRKSMFSSLSLRAIGTKDPVINHRGSWGHTPKGLTPFDLIRK